MSDTVVRTATDSPEATMAMAAAFATVCRPNDVIALQGTLGAGKTCFVKGLARGLGVAEEKRVISPTFVLMRRYVGRLHLHHFDAYRLRSSAEMEEIGCAETFDAGGVSVVEWAGRVADCLPAEHFCVAITVAGATRRGFRVVAGGQVGARRLGELRRVLDEWLGRPDC
jgi:tRNA threonylcarbamoyladenosine biosynthesis protein TsaE